MNRIFYKFLVAFFVILVFLCCKEDQSNRLKIGMFVVGANYNDAGYTENCKKGVVMALAENSFDTLFMASSTFSRDQIDYFSKNGFNLLFVPGEYGTNEICNSAMAFPDLQYVIIDHYDEGNLPNVQSIFFKIDEAAFPLGFLAAYWANLKDPGNPVIAVFGGMDTPAIRRFTDAYQSGVAWFNQKYNKQVVCLEQFLNTFSDSDKGYRLADSLIQNGGADVLLPVAGAAGNGVLKATYEKHKWAIGVDVDQYYSLPEYSSILLSSCIKRLDTSIYTVTRNFINNPEPSHSIYIGSLENQGVALAPFHDFEEQIPDSIRNEIEAIQTAIINGTIDTGF